MYGAASTITGQPLQQVTDRVRIENWISGKPSKGARCSSISILAGLSQLRGGLLSWLFSIDLTP